MALDRVGLDMIAPHLKGRSVLCLGYPDVIVPAEHLQSKFNVTPTEFTDHGAAHGVKHRLPETVHTLKMFGVTEVDCVDSMPSRGVERLVDLNVKQDWGRQYGVIINPGTLEHCFDVATAWFNAWAALEKGGHILQVAPMTMVNHGFWNFSPTAFFDFAEYNGGRVLKTKARDRDWWEVSVDPVKRFKCSSEVVIYCLVEKVEEVAPRIPVQKRFRQ